jgi:hypothetical protein
MRSIRRHHSERMKRKAAKLFLRWHKRRGVEPELCKGSYSNGDGVTHYRVYTAQEVGNRIGKIAAMHGTHICGMCKYEKRYDQEHKRHESVRILELTQA